MVMILENQHKITSFDPESIHLYPALPGVYLMKDRTGKILYIGKAKNIRTRLRTYFSAPGDGRPSVDIFLPKVTAIETIITSNEKEAFLLENILIKKERPQYNIRLKDDKTYISLMINPKAPWPRLEWVRKRRRDDVLFFGPFSSSSSARKTVEFVEKIFPLRTCSDNVMKNRTRPCIRYEMKRCLGPCCLPVSRDDYQSLVNGVILYLRGNMKELTSRLEAQMLEHAVSLRFEKAAELRDRIEAVRETVEKQNISDERTRDVDVIAHHFSEGWCQMTVFQYRMGILAGTRAFTFREQERPPAEIYYAFFGQYYSEDAFIPPEILAAVEPDERELLEEWLSDIRHAIVKILCPQRGRRADIMKMALDNSKDLLRRKLEGERDLSLILQSLQNKLALPELPSHIEGFDISNIQGRLAVGSMVVFSDGNPEKSAYRHYTIQTVSGSDDFAMIHEVVLRRYRRLRDENKPLPNLILIDGGKGQLNAALGALRELGLEALPIIGLAKDRLKDDQDHPGEKSGTGERIFLPGRKNPVVLYPGSPALFLIQRIRDEAHRFAITHHKKRRSKELTRSALDSIPGVGAARKKALMKCFGSLRALEKASFEEIRNTPGITISAARNIHEFLNIRRLKKKEEE